MANETVLFKRGDSATITSTPVTDGQILFDTSGNGKMYLDNGTDRLEMGGAITVDASLSKTSTNAIQNKAVTGNILNSLAEVSAATQQNTIAGALALKEVNSSFVSNIYVGSDGKLHKVQGGADSVLPFSKKVIFTARGILSDNANVVIDVSELKSIKITHSTEYKCNATILADGASIKTLTPNTSATIDVSNYSLIRMNYIATNSWVGITVETL